MKTETKAPDQEVPDNSEDLEERVFEGLGVSPGIIVGPAHLRDGGDVQVLEYRLPQGKLNEEVERFQDAVERARRQVGNLKSKAESYHGAAAEELGYLLDAHLQMLKSNSLLGAVEQRIRREMLNAEASVMAEITEISKNFAEMDDPYLRARAQEVREVGLRIVRNLTKTEYGGFAHLEPGSIVIAEEITPADTALMDPKRIGGFATDLGGAEGHTAIMARSLGIPAVLGITGLFAGIKTGDSVLVDGSNGRVIVNPTAKRLSDYKLRRQALARETRSLALLRDVDARTRDGENISLQANLELPRDLVQAVAAGAQGVGLLRTEFMFMNREDLPAEDEQYDALRTIVEGMDGYTVTIRTLDVGGEKLASSLGDHVGTGVNPALGLRAIRLSLKEISLLETQLAAILRAGAHGQVRILLPMISSTNEVKEVKKILFSVAERLQAQGIRIADPLPPVGAMIEIPGAALAADALAQVVDFFAIGTNDLTMYTLAIDRSEEQVAHLYNPLHPAVLRLIQFSVGAALRARIPVSVCGEMAGDPRFTALLLGLGVRDLSMSATGLPRVKKRVLKIDMRAASHRAMAIMDQHDSGRISALLDDFNESH
ncbi:phosphoenolpyruvate--protein phosphotransferase [Denitrobaculum tricleocarpae]|uniref:Phosphoenolpyruvate-protein phosphotransferase n=1 Tax=Denitrobaculum tricleocarpae TaxID=2591009 RepID=A0A545TG38_9PROT|nr:phosphoenolpyruvate--protein phosphotransferase [Denitrobaculum tricleocarpae]TQV76187.1 phosphoenolpyruvate--protein phosphotransferase [Denitrobaculum tricleocarpae]